MARHLLGEPEHVLNATMVEAPPGSRYRPMTSPLQPRVLQAATPRSPACKLHVRSPATLCDPACKPMCIRADVSTSAVLGFAGGATARLSSSALSVGFDLTARCERGTLSVRYCH